MSEGKCRTVSRREALGVLGATAAVLSTACGGGSPTSPSTSRSTGSTVPTSTSTCVAIPSETEGPYPNLTVPTRRDIREDRTGLPLTVAITIVNPNAACAPVSPALVEIWHCDAQGNYSEYLQPGFDGTGRTFLRGAQVTDDAGKVTFTSIYPGWYQGRATHIHVEVSIGGTPVKTTQMAFPDDVTAAVYATGVYAGKGQNPIKNAGDTVFGDGVASQLATLSGNTATGYTATLMVGVAL